MRDDLEEAFTRIADEALDAAASVSSSLESYRDGLKLISETITERWKCVRSECEGRKG